MDIKTIAIELLLLLNICHLRLQFFFFCLFIALEPDSGQNSQNLANLPVVFEKKMSGITVIDNDKNRSWDGRGIG